MITLGSWHDVACGQDCQFVLQHVEECDRVVETVHEQHVILVGDLCVLHKTEDDTAG